MRRASSTSVRRTVLGRQRRAPSLGDLLRAISGKGAHTCQLSTHPAARRALILAASASLALTAVATTVASADAKPGGRFHPRTADTAAPGQSDNLRTDLMKKQDNRVR